VKKKRRGDVCNGNSEAPALKNLKIENQGTGRCDRDALRTGHKGGGKRRSAPGNNRARVGVPGGRSSRYSLWIRLGRVALASTRRAGIKLSRALDEEHQKQVSQIRSWVRVQREGKKQHST